MNKLQEKATELAELAKAYGLDPQIQVRGDWVVYVDYTRNLHSQILFTDTGRVSVKSWERFGRKSEPVSLNL
jgi:hypothetical protein